MDNYSRTSYLVVDVIVRTWHLGLAAVLTVSWGPLGRLLEADIYGKIPSGGYPGVTKFRDGGPALYPAASGSAFSITVNSLRGELGMKIVKEANSHLRRAVITPMGRPLWTCEWKVLLKTAMAAIRGLHFYQRL